MNVLTLTKELVILPTKVIYSGIGENCNSGSPTRRSHVQVLAQQGKNTFIEGEMQIYDIRIGQKFLRLSGSVFFTCFPWTPKHV